jgi:hypothetical protein
MQALAKPHSWQNLHQYIRRITKDWQCGLEAEIQTETPLAVEAARPRQRGPYKKRIAEISE